MASSLSSLLVQRGVVTIRQIEAALERQAILGGALDSALLEADYCDERSLLAALSIASQIEAALPEDILAAKAAASDMSQELSDQYDVVPCGWAEGSMRVLVREPWDFDRLEGLATELQVPLEPLVACEVRWIEAKTRAYGQALPPRFARLLGKLAVTSTAVDSSSLSSVSGELSSGANRGKQVALPPAVAQVVAHEISPTPKSPQADSVPVPIHDDVRRVSKQTLVGFVPAASFSEVGDTRVEDPKDMHAVGEIVASTHTPNVAMNEPRVVVAEAALTGSQPSPLPISAQVTARLPAAPRSYAPEPKTPAPSSPPRHYAPDAPTPIATRVRQAGEKSGPVVRGDLSAGAAGVVKETRRTLPPDALSQTRPFRIREKSRPHSAIREESAPSAPVQQPVFDASVFAAAESRDEVFSLSLRALATIFEHSAVFSVQDDVAVGRLALGRAGLERESIAEVSIPLDRASPFRIAFDTLALYVGPLGSTDERVLPAVKRWISESPKTFFVAPVVMKGRAVALLAAHTRRGSLGISDLGPLATLGAAVAQALSQLILRGKSDTSPKTPAQSWPALRYAEPPPQRTKKSTSSELPAIERPRRATLAPSAARESTRIVSDLRPSSRGAHVPASQVADAELDQWLDAIEATDDLRRSPATRKLLELADDRALQRVTRRFPDSRALAAVAVQHHFAGRAAQLSPLVALAVEFGERITPWLVGRLSDVDERVRYVTAILFAEFAALPQSAAGASGGSGALLALSSRLLDDEPRVRQVAIRALAGASGDLRELALEPIRRAAQDRKDHGRLERAVSLLVELIDIASIPLFIELLGTGDEHSFEAARRALTQLTKHDFGREAAKWRMWWGENRSRHRVEWLIDALAAESDAIRMSAADELRRATGEYFGYHYDLPKRERDEAKQRWVTWWRSVGREQFARQSRTK